MKDDSQQKLQLLRSGFKTTVKWGQGAVFPILIILIWQYFAISGRLNPYLLPPPTHVMRSFLDLLDNGKIGEQVLTSLYRLGLGMVITILIAVPLGLALGWFPRIEKLLTPTLTFLQQIPAIAWIPVFILWFGIGESSKIAVLIYASFFPVFINTFFGIQSLDPKLKEVSNIFCLRFKTKILRVFLPSAAPYFFVGLRLGLSNGWRALVAAEIINASRGIGYLLMEGRNLAQPEQIFISIFIIGFLGTAMDYGLRTLEKRLLPWSQMQEKS